MFGSKSKGIQRKWLISNLPQATWRVRCSKGEVSDAVNKFLAEKILA